MDIAVKPKALNGETEAPSSKSYMHRLLIAAFISGQKVFIECGEFSKDIAATCDVLSAMGAEIKKEKGGVVIERKFVPSGEITADCNESGSTLRFLLPLAAALGIKARFTGTNRLLSRPIKPLTDVLNMHGAKVNGFSVEGKLQCGRYIVDSSLSSQFVTGLLFALVSLNGTSILEITGKKVSEGYVKITLEILKMFGADITESGDNFIVNGGLKDNGDGTRHVKAEGDWSNSAFFLAAGAINGDITVRGLNFHSQQGDRKIFEVLKSFGAKAETEGDKIRVSNGKLKAINLDIDDIPDLAQIISVVAAFADGVTVLNNVDRLRLKESDRVDAIIKTLSAADIRAEYSENKIFIFGGSPEGGNFDGGNDHRTVMSAAILAACAKDSSLIKGAEACEKSFPDFFEKFSCLGGIADVVI